MVDIPHGFWPDREDLHVIPYLFEQLGVGLSHAYRAYDHTIQGFDRKEWGLVLIAFAAFGALCMKSMRIR
jgi:hypothetical protein